MASRILTGRRTICILVGLVLISPVAVKGQRKVNEVIFHGNVAFGHSELDKMVRVDKASLLGVFSQRAIFNYLIMSRDITYLRAFYRNRGYLQCMVEERTESVDDDGLIVHFTIREGFLTVLQKFDFEGNEHLSDDELRGAVGNLKDLRLSEGDPVNEAAIQAGAVEVLKRYQEQGFYFANVIPSVGVRDSTSGAAPIIYRIREGPIVRVSNVEVEGNRDCKRFVITREVTLDPGDLLIEEERRESQRRLYSTGIFRTVSVTVGEVSPDSTSAVILVTVNERPRRYVGAGFGLAGDEQEQIDLRVRTSAQWGHRNVFGTGRAIELSGNSDFRVITAWESVQSELGVRYLEPWFWSSRMPLNVYFGLRPQSFESYKVREFAAEFGLSREFSLQSKGWINFTFRRITTEEKIPLQYFSTRENLRGFNSMFERDSRDNILSPVSGSLLRIRFDSYGMLGLGGPNYSVTTFNWSRYHLAGSRTIMATRVRLGFARAGKNIDEVPIFDRFFAGGSSSVRGYEERQLGPVYEVLETTTPDSTTIEKHFMPKGGQIMALFNLELRRPGYLGPLGLVIFLDAGNVWATVEDMSKDVDLAFSAGLGLFVDTPIGPIQVGYGWRLNLSLVEKKNPDYRLRSGDLYITVLHAF